MQYYKNNTVAHFFTKLPTCYELDGEWEVGLSSISFPHDWYNVRHGQKIRFMRRDDNSIYIDVPPGYYPHPWELVAKIQFLIKEEYSKPQWVRQGRNENHVFRRIPDEDYPSIVFDVHTSKVTVKIPPKTKMTVTAELADMLGFDAVNIEILNKDRSEELMVTLPRPCDPSTRIHSMYVYCDVVEHIHVGDVKAPLLAICDAQGQFGATINRTYDKPRYVPVQKKNFDTIEIDIRTNAGEPMPFESGPSVVILHFKRSRGSYFK